MWLEHWLLHHHLGITLVVSHDQLFLASLCSDILQLSSALVGPPRSSQLVHFGGDYASYKVTLAEQRALAARLREGYDKEKDKLQEFIRRDGKKYDNPAHQAQVRRRRRRSAVDLDTTR